MTGINRNCHRAEKRDNDVILSRRMTGMNRNTPSLFFSSSGDLSRRMTGMNRNYYKDAYKGCSNLSRRVAGTNRNSENACQLEDTDTFPSHDGNE